MENIKDRDRNRNGDRDRDIEKYTVIEKERDINIPLNIITKRHCY